MSLGFLFGGGVGTEVRGTEMYRSYPVMRDLYEQVSEWTGLTVGQILEEELPTAQEERQSAGTIRETALALGIHDVLVEHGLRPSALGGLSLGAMTASCLAGAIGRRELFEMLAHTRHTPELPPESPEQGLALAFAPVEGDLVAAYRGEGRAGVHLSGVFGVTADGAMQILMLSGERSALEEVAADLPPGTIAPLPDRPIAVHSPLRGHHREFMAPYVGAMPFTAPELPLFSCLEQKKLTTAEGVRDLFDRNSTDAISLPDVCAGMKEEGVRLALIMGGSIPDGILRFPFPVVHVDQPEHVQQVLTSAFDLGIDLAPAQTGR
ncbi:ACP S-malonyltransferase [Streptomyces humidus]|uniref:ACP S-malonyltransferase n=1 Tax=Streptomyces humidus TaxID=52259 RepID=UPI00167D1137|nr:ACP S-malonyltransferase [Streptomyces humidus]